MHIRGAFFSMAVWLAALSTAGAQPPASVPGGVGQRGPMGPVHSDRFRTQYVRLGSNNAEGLLYEPTTPSPQAHIALVFSHPDENTFNEPPGRELAARGYPILMVNYHGSADGPEVFAPSISRGIEFMRTLPGVQKVVVVGHSGGGPLMAFYDNVAEHGATACQDAKKLYPCNGNLLTNLAKPDGVILIDAAPGAFHTMSALDPAVLDRGRDRDASLDMFTQANGFDAQARRARYSVDFARRFFAAQSVRNDEIIDHALQRVHLLDAGKGEFTDDEPLIVRGMGREAAGARLYQPDTSFWAHTRKPHTLLKADGTTQEEIVQSVRPPTGMQFAADVGSLDVMSQETTVKRFLRNSAIRTTTDYALTADDVEGVDWDSSINSTPGNAQGITVPALVMVMSCHYFVVPGEITYDHLASKDKTYAAVEGAVHVFTPCRPEYGDTVKRTFDYVAAWLSKPGRF